MHPLFNDVKNLVLDTLFPVQCLNCQQEGLFLCFSCQMLLKRVYWQECIVCRKASFNGLTHPECRSASVADALISALDYHDPLVAKAIISGKYYFLFDVFKQLGDQLTDYIIEKELTWLFSNAVLCPIPLAKQRQRWRGFNQSEIIAQQLSQHFDVPVMSLIKRVKNTKTQKDLTKPQRLANMAQSFAVIGDQSIAGRNIILIDDVITTGATLLEATKLLKLHGAAQVYCLTLARD